MTTRQASLAEFEDCLAAIGGIIPLMDREGQPTKVDRITAEAISEDIGRIPSGKGFHNRCMMRGTFNPSTMSRVPEGKWLADWWFHGVLWRFRKLLGENGEVSDRLVVSQDPNFRVEKTVDAAVIEDGCLVFTTKDGRQYSVKIDDDYERDPYDLKHTYDPTVNGEDLMLEAFRHKLPRELLIAADGLPCDLSYLGPEQLAGEESVAAEIAEKCGITPRFSQDVPVLKPDFDYNPVDQTCNRCLCNRKDGCARGLENNMGWCFEWIWNRKPFKTKKTKKSKKKVIEEKDEGYDE